MTAHNGRVESGERGLYIACACVCVHTFEFHSYTPPPPPPDSQTWLTWHWHFFCLTSERRKEDGDPFLSKLNYNDPGGRFGDFPVGVLHT